MGLRIRFEYGFNCITCQNFIAIANIDLSIKVYVCCYRESKVLSYFADITPWKALFVCNQYYVNVFVRMTTAIANDCSCKTCCLPTTYKTVGEIFKRKWRASWSVTLVERQPRMVVTSFKLSTMLNRRTADSRMVVSQFIAL